MEFKLIIGKELANKSIILKLENGSVSVKIDDIDRVQQQNTDDIKESTIEDTKELSVAPRASQEVETISDKDKIDKITYILKSSMEEASFNSTLKDALLNSRIENDTLILKFRKESERYFAQQLYIQVLEAAAKVEGLKVELDDEVLEPKQTLADMLNEVNKFAKR